MGTRPAFYRRPRLLAAASAPEGGRGGAGSGLPRETRDALHDAAPQRRPAIDYRGRRHRRVPLRPSRRAVLLPGDEHPAPGRAPGHRAGARRRPRRAAARPWPRGDRRTRARSARRDGHAIEVRLYAEDPAADYQPQSGHADPRRDPRLDGEFDLLNRPGLRLDAGFETGSEVSTHYDAMLAKVIARAPTREQAVRRLAAVLRGPGSTACVTNRDLLVAVLARPAFLAGEVCTAFLADRPFSPTGARRGRGGRRGARPGRARPRARRTVQRGIPVAWRNVVCQPQAPSSRTARAVRVVGRPRRLRRRRAHRGRGQRGPGRARARRRPHDVRRGGHRRPGRRRRGRRARPAAPSSHGSSTRPTRWRAAACWRRCPAPSSASPSSRATRSRPGRPVLVLEAMKMQHTVTAPRRRHGDRDRREARCAGRRR